MSRPLLRPPTAATLVPAGAASAPERALEHVAREGRSAQLRALFVVNSLSVGGSETKTVRVVNALLHRDLRTGLAYLNPPEHLLRAVDTGVPVWHLHREGKFSWPAVRSLRKLITAERPGAVIAMSLYPTLYVLLATRAMRSRPRTIAMINTTDFPRGRSWEPSFYAPVLRRFDRVVYGCQLQRERWSRWARSHDSHSEVIYNGVDTEHFGPVIDVRARAGHRAHFGIDPQAFVIGTVARLAVEKNHAALIDATAQLRRRALNVHLLVVGEGPLKAELQQRVEDLGLRSHVTFAGAHADVRPALSAMDVFVLPSTHVETFSNAALEAMASARPVILSRIGGAAEMVRDGVEGYTVDPTNLGTELPRLLDELFRNEALRERLGAAARERVTKEFSLQMMVSRYGALIDPSRCAGAC